MRATCRRVRLLVWSAALGGLLWLSAGQVQAKELTQESWDAIFMGGSKVGHVHIDIKPITDGGRQCLRVGVDTVLNFRRGKDLVTTKLAYSTTETLEGSVVKLETRTLTGGDELRVSGDVIDGKMKLVIKGGGQQQEEVIPWGPEVRGPYAAEQSLERKPMKPGETRELKMFMPDLNKLCDITLAAKQEEEVPLANLSKRRLLRIEQTTKLDGKSRTEFDLRMWVDSNGQVLKSVMDVMEMVTYRTTKEDALAPGKGIAVDRIAQSVIRVKNKIKNSTATRAMRYRVTLPGEDLSQILPGDRRQTVKPEGESKSTVILDVKTARPNDGEPDNAEISPQFLRANAIVTSEDPRVIKLAHEAVGDATDPWEKASRITSWVFQKITRKNFGKVFAPAREVARDLAGDCTEHSVLSAAMCRAVGIPSRVAIGLVYEGQELKGFGFHMWTEVHVNGRWVALDSTWDQTEVDATHIKLADTSLDGVAPFEAFLPVARVLGKMSIVPIEIR